MHLAKLVDLSDGVVAPESFPERISSRFRTTADISRG
jgi:hypothetical protein